MMLQDYLILNQYLNMRRYSIWRFVSFYLILFLLKSNYISERHVFALCYLLLLGSVLSCIQSDLNSDSVDVLSMFEVIMFSFKFDCVTLVFSCYSDSVKALDYWLTTDSVGQLYEYLDSKAIGYEFA